VFIQEIPLWVSAQTTRHCCTNGGIHFQWLNDLHMHYSLLFLLEIFRAKRYSINYDQKFISQFDRNRSFFPLEEGLWETSKEDGRIIYQILKMVSRGRMCATTKMFISWDITVLTWCNWKKLVESCWWGSVLRMTVHLSVELLETHLIILTWGILKY